MPGVRRDFGGGSIKLLFMCTLLDLGAGARSINDTGRAHKEGVEPRIGISLEYPGIAGKMPLLAAPYVG
jgi:hypothetical protein